MKLKYKTTVYFFLVFFGGGLLLFREEIQGEAQIIVTVIALFVMMFGLYKVTSMQTSNKHKTYDTEEYFNKEKYSEEEEKEEEQTK